MNDSQRKARVKRTFYPNGQVESETPYVGDKITGVVRRWYENGTLQSETSKLNSLEHGATREFSADGQLSSTGEFSHGSGVFRSWYPNGHLQSEVWVHNRIPHGRLRCWDETGELIVEQFFISGRKVSRKKYFAAGERDESLPKYDANDAPPTWAQLYPEKPINARPPSDADYEDTRDALDWLRKSSTSCLRTLGELPTAEESINLVEVLLEKGASRVLAVNVQVDDDVENAGELLVELPKEANVRRRVLRQCNKWNQDCGYTPVKDSGQRFVHVVLD